MSQNIIEQERIITMINKTNIYEQLLQDSDDSTRHIKYNA